MAPRWFQKRKEGNQEKETEETQDNGLMTPTEPSPNLQTDEQSPAVPETATADAPYGWFEKRKARRQAKEQAKARQRAEIAANPSSVYAATQVRYIDPTFEHPPELNYTLKTRYKWIAFFWGLVALDCIAMPLGLYFGLWYGTSLSPNAVFSISTGALGSVSIIEYFLRFYRLWKKGSTCRVIGARRWYLDWFHWNLSAAWIAIMIELIIGTVPAEPPIRLLAMPVSSLCFAFGVELLLVDLFRIAGYRAPIRISSLPRGSPLRPGIYSIIEDVIAVDGSGGTEFRQRLNLRYQASHYFRQMLHRITLFWAFGSCAIAAATTAIIFTTSRDVAYVIGWTLPFVWAGVWALVTTIWVKIELKREENVWQKERGKGPAAA